MRLYKTLECSVKHTCKENKKQLTTRTRTSASVPIKDKYRNMLLSKEEQDKRWFECFSDMLNQPSPLTTYDFTKLTQPEELEVNMEPITIN